jgi:ArsR family transcriptional regulator
MNELVKAFKALSDETRIRIYKFIMENPDICVCDIMESLGMSQTRISRNLATLKNAGLVDSRRDGKWMHYSAVNQSRCCSDVMSTVKKWVMPVKGGKGNKR